MRIDALSVILLRITTNPPDFMEVSRKRSMLGRLLRKMPLPVLAIVVGFLVGSSTWLVIDSLQTRSIKQMFESELQKRLEKQARESLVRFEHFVQQYRAISRLLAHHKVLAQHLSPLFWTRSDIFFKVSHYDEVPDWLPEGLLWQSLPQPNYMLLIDRYNKVREEYQLTRSPVPHELLEMVAWEKNISRSFFAEVSGQSYLVLIDQTEDESDNIMGALVSIVLLDSNFLNASQQGVSTDGSVVALLNVEDHRVLVSSNETLMLEQMLSDELSPRYVVTSQSLPDSTDAVNLLFGTFIPRSGTRATIERVLEIEREQRWIGALAFIAVFTILFALISLRLNRVLKRISDFARRALGMSELTVRRGNPIYILDEWMREFSQLVLTAREEMKEKHEVEIRESEALKAAIMDTSLDSIITVDETGRIIDFNPTAEKIFGYRAEQAIGQFIEPLIITQQSRQLFWNTLHDCLQITGEVSPQLRSEMLAKRMDGVEFPVEIAIRPLLMKEHFLFTVYLHDMSMRKQQEQEIRNLAAFPGESPMPVIRVNRRGVVIYANPPSVTLLKYWGVEFLQTLPFYWRHQVEKVLENDAEKEIEVEYDESFYSLLLVPIPEGNYVNIYGRDITETRLAEAESRQHHTELVHVGRLSTMGEMATGIAHELNQPLSAVMNYARGSIRRLKDNPEDTESILQALEKISSQAYRAGEIIKRMRGMLAKQPSVRDIGDLNQLVGEVVTFVEFEARKSAVTIRQNLFQDSLPLVVDFVQIEQVVLNVVKNALDALAEQDMDDRQVTIETGFCDNKQHVFISVSDNGPGISEEVRLQLFNPFFTTKSSGMGMGLAISKTIIDDHKGEIVVEGQPGQGMRCISRLHASADTDIVRGNSDS